MATLAQVAAFRAAGDQLGAVVADELEAIWGRLDLSDPRAVSHDLQLIVPDIVAEYGDISATLAADYFDEVTADYDLRTHAATLAPTAPAEQTKAVTRWGVGPLFSAEPQYLAALAMIQEGIHRLVLQAGRDTIETNVRRTKLVYARIPSGREPCAFCLVLASRGAVYGSREAAGGDKYHTKCRCVPTPVRSEDDLPRGYDLARFREVYEANAGGSLTDVTASIREATHAR